MYHYEQECPLQKPVNVQAFKYLGLFLANTEHNYCPNCLPSFIFKIKKFFQFWSKWAKGIFKLTYSLIYTRVVYRLPNALTFLSVTKQNYKKQLSDPPDFPYLLTLMTGNVYVSFHSLAPLFF